MKFLTTVLWKKLSFSFSAFTIKRCDLYQCPGNLIKKQLFSTYDVGIQVTVGDSVVNEAKRLPSRVLPSRMELCCASLLLLYTISQHLNSPPVGNYLIVIG